MESLTNFFKVVWFYVCLCFKKYCDFKGRARRKEYWSFAVFTFLVGRLFDFAYNLTGFEFIIYLAMLFSVGTIVPLWAVAFRRLHDIGYSGKYGIGAIVMFFVLIGIGSAFLYYQSEIIGSFICLVAILAFLVAYFYYFLKDSEPGENEWGANPKEFEN